MDNDLLLQINVFLKSVCPCIFRNTEGQVVVETNEQGNLQSLQVDGQRINVNIVSGPKESRTKRIINRLSAISPSKQKQSKHPPNRDHVSPHTTDVANPVDDPHLYETLQEHYTSLQEPHERHRSTRPWHSRLSWFGRKKNQEVKQSSGRKRRGKPHDAQARKDERSQKQKQKGRKKIPPRTKDSELYEDCYMYSNNPQNVDLSVIGSASNKSDDSHLEYVGDIVRKVPVRPQESTGEIERVRDAGYMNPLPFQPRGNEDQI